MTAPLLAILILIVAAIIGAIISSIFEYFVDKRTAKRLWEEHLSERGERK